MKVAVCSAGDTLDSSLDPRFGRCACFVIVDNETFEATAVPNPGAMSAQGAGIQAAQNVAQLGVDAVLTGHVGPNAYRALSAGGVTVYTGVGGTVEQALEELKAGKLSPADSEDVEGHWV